MDARLGLASVYGSCEVARTAQGINKLPTNSSCGKPIAWLAKTPSEIWSSATSDCRAPALPFYSSRPGQRPDDFDPDAIDLAPVGATDCSSFVSGVLCRAGLRVTPNQSACHAPRTADMVKIWGVGNSCMKPVRFSKSDSLHSGDILLATGDQGHILIVDRIGPDPFGLRKLKNRADCTREPDADLWDFTVIESTSKPISGVKAGASIWSSTMDYKIRTAAGKGLEIPVAYVRLWKMACLSHFSGIRSPPAKFDDEIKGGLFRHSGKAECLEDPGKYKFENCLAEKRICLGE